MASADRAFTLSRCHLAARLAQLREQERWTQEEAAERAGVDEKHWQKLELQQLNPTLRTLTKIATGLGLHVTELLAPTTAKPPSRPVGRPAGLTAKRPRRVR
jgi:transcriptional regulator with XRE-family HTH domain